MRFLAYYSVAVAGCFAVYGFCCLAGKAYLDYRLVQNAKGHQAWMEFKRCHR